MGLSNLVASSSGGIKSVQRGSAASAGTVTISSVNTSKSFVNVYGTASSGTVAGTGTISAASGNISSAGGSNGTALMGAGNNTPNWSNLWGATSSFYGQVGVFLAASNYNINGKSFSGNASNFSGGSTNLVTAVVQGYLSGSTSLEASGACRWEVVEFN